jgi:hypothetical protein
MPRLNVVSFSGVFQPSPVGSGVDANNASDVKINTTDDKYLSINEQVQKKNPGYLFYLVINKQGKQPPPLNLCFKVFQNLLYCTTRFNCLLSIDRVNLSKACAILVA